MLSSKRIDADLKRTRATWAKVKLYITQIQVCMHHSTLNLIDTDS